MKKDQKLSLKKIKKKAGKQKQKLLTDILLRELPAEKREKLEKEEERRRRLELQEAKENIWKKWRGKTKSKESIGEESGEKMMKRIELMIKEDREEREEKRKKKEKEKDKELENEKVNKAQKVIRIKKKKKLEEQLDMIRWLTTYMNASELDWENVNNAEMEMSVAEMQEKDEEMAKVELQGGDECGKAEPREKVVNEPRVCVAKLPANADKRTASLQNESGIAETEVKSEDNGTDCEKENTSEMELSVAEMQEEKDEEEAELKLQGGDECGRAEPRKNVMDEQGVSLAKSPAKVGTRTSSLQSDSEHESGSAEKLMTSEAKEIRLSLANKPASEGTQKAEFEQSGLGDGRKTESGKESGREKPDLSNVGDEMELSLANMPANVRGKMDEFGASQTVPDDEDTNYNDAEASLVTTPKTPQPITPHPKSPKDLKTSRVSVQLHESGKAQQEDAQIPPPPSHIQHQSMTLGSEKLYCYPSNSGKPFGQAGGELRYLAPLGGGGGDHPS